MHSGIGMAQSFSSYIQLGPVYTCSWVVFIRSNYAVTIVSVDVGEPIESYIGVYLQK